MIKILFKYIAFTLLVNSSIFGQTYDSTHFHHNHIIPTFPGGLDSLKSYLVKKLKYPQTAINDSIQGTVIVGFFVNSNGEIDDVIILRSVRKDLDEAAMISVKAMPKWNKGTIRIPFSLPIVFKLND